MKVHRVMQGEWGSCLFSCNFCPPSGAYFSPPLLCRYIFADSKSKQEMREVSPLLLVPSREMCHQTFAYIHVLRLYLTRSNCGLKNPPFFQKILGPLILISTHFLVFFALFHLPYSGISQKNRSYRNCGHEKMA